MIIYIDTETWVDVSHLVEHTARILPLNHLDGALSQWSSAGGAPSVTSTFASVIGGLSSASLLALDETTTVRSEGGDVTAGLGMVTFGPSAHLE